MTEVLKLAGLGVASALLALSLRPTRPEMAMLVALAAGLLLFAAAAGRLSEIVSALQSLADRAGLSDGALPQLLRIVGVAAVAEIAGSLCRDAGEGALAQKIELGGKLAVLAMAMPLALALTELVLGLMP